MGQRFFSRGKGLGYFLVNTEIVKAEVKFSQCIGEKRKYINIVPC